MAVKKPDEYQHNNPDLAFVDGSFVRGGRRAPVADRAALYALASKADQLRAGSTVVRVLSDSVSGGAATELLLVDAAQIGLAAGWAPYFTAGNLYDAPGQATDGAMSQKATTNLVSTSVAAVSGNVDDIHDNKAVLTHPDRSRVYYRGVGTAGGLMVNGVSQGPNSDDGVIQALKAAVAGDFVSITTPITMPFVTLYAPILVVNPGVILDLNGFFVSTLQSQDCLKVTGSGNYLIFGRNAKMLSNGNGSAGIFVGQGTVANFRLLNLDFENRGSANSMTLSAGTHYHTGSLYVENLGAWGTQTGIFNLAGDTVYDFLGDIRVNGLCTVFTTYGTSSTRFRNGNLVLLQTNSEAGVIYESAKVEFSRYVIDLTKNPTGGGIQLATASVELILTDVSVLGGSIIRGSTQGTVRLRGTTALPAAYGLAYIRAMGVSVIDERGEGLALSSTDGLPEGITNEYFTPARAVAALVSSGDLLHLVEVPFNVTTSAPVLLAHNLPIAPAVDVYDSAGALMQPVRTRYDANTLAFYITPPETGSFVYARPRTT